MCSQVAKHARRLVENSGYPIEEGKRRLRVGNDGQRDKAEREQKNAKSSNHGSGQDASRNYLWNSSPQHEQTKHKESYSKRPQLNRPRSARCRLGDWWWRCLKTLVWNAHRFTLLL